RGRVLDSAGVAIPEADGAMVELHQLTRSDAQGRFTFSKVPRGEHQLSVRRPRFEPAAGKALVGDLAYSYEIGMKPHAATLTGVDVNAEKKLRLGIEDFYRRRARGSGGMFFTRSEIEARNPRRVTDVLSNSPGLQIVPGRRGSGAGVRFTGKRQC